MVRFDRDVREPTTRRRQGRERAGPAAAGPSDLATFLRNKMVKAGMSEEGANLICSSARRER